MNEEGFFDSWPVFNQDWVIKDFQKSAEAGKSFVSPKFQFQDFTFALTCQPFKM